jgi:hypothetical protein
VPTLVISGPRAINKAEIKNAVASSRFKFKIKLVTLVKFLEKKLMRENIRNLEKF